MSTVIKVENVSKLYRLGEIGTGSIAHDVNRWWHKMRGNEDPYLKIGQVNERDRRPETGNLKPEEREGTASSSSTSGLSPQVSALSSSSTSGLSPQVSGLSSSSSSTSGLSPQVSGLSSSSTSGLRSQVSGLSPQPSLPLPTTSTPSKTSTSKSNRAKSSALSAVTEPEKAHS